MKRYGQKALLLLLLIILAAACTAKKADNSPPDGPKGQEEKPISVYLPLQTGNSWQYLGTGNEYASYKQNVTFKQDNKYQVMIDNGGTVSANRFEVTADRIVKTYQEGEAYDNKNILDKPANIEAIVLKLPVKAGTSWSSEGNAYKIVQTDAQVKVPAGDFNNCVVVEVTYKEGNSKSLNYYKEGVGLVKSEFILESGEKIISDLEKYTLAGNSPQ